MTEWDELQHRKYGQHRSATKVKFFFRHIEILRLCSLSLYSLTAYAIAGLSKFDSFEVSLACVPLLISLWLLVVASRLYAGGGYPGHD